ncbi:MAG: ComEC/Rec2 family competence protein [Microbacterium sp.]|uniref:ComEC/Rec2 family competence protein n=1 Tax=Microbacterium sp. TaxID=51671 RepID=UPI003A8A8BE3
MRNRAPLLPLAVAGWASAIVAVMAPDWAAVHAATLWLVTGVLCCCALRRRRLALTVMAVAAAATIASHVAWAQPARDAAASFGVEGGRAVELTAVVTSKVAPAGSGSLWFDAHATALRAGDRSIPVSVPVVVSVAPDGVAGSGLDLGAQVVVTGTAMRADPGDRAVLVVFGSGGVAVTSAPEPAYAAVSALRTGFVDLASTLPGDGGALLPGLAVGDTSAVGAGLDAAMKDSSLSHLTAVSGANCAIIVGLVFGAAALLGARRGVRVIAALTALAGFVLLVTPEPSVVRAAAMATAAMLGVLLGRTAVGTSALCLAVVVLLVGDPWLAVSLGFALSTVATAALLVLAPPLARGLTRVMPKALALVLAVPLAAQLACGPLLVLVNPTVPLYGVVANLVAGPAAPVATVLGLVACLLAPVLPVVAHGVAAIAWVPSAWVAATATTVTELPAASLPWLDGWVGAAALALVGACIAVLLALWRPGVRTLMLRLAATVLLSTTAGVLLGSAALGGPIAALTIPRAWSIAVCDVGQGDAVLVRSGEHVALIDTGPDPALLRACLRRLGVSRLDLVVLTHFDHDHIGGAETVVGLSDLVLHGPPTDAQDRALLSRFADSGSQVVEAHSGVSGRLGDADWRVLWPRRTSVAFPAGNDASVVLDVRGGGVPSALFLGDLSATPQAILAGDTGLRGPYDVVKVAHHGSVDQDAGLYRAVRAAVAIVPVGADNTYGHPRRETLQLVASVGAAIGRTDRDGLVLVARGAGGLQLWRERSSPHDEVAPVP